MAVHSHHLGAARIGLQRLHKGLANAAAGAYHKGAETFRE